MLSTKDTRIFEDARPRLLGLAYRVLGSLADAEDAVQDTFVKWAQTDRAAINNPASYLTTLCTRRCIDLLRSANRSRVDYVGAWLPEPIQKTMHDDAEDNPALENSLKTAFLLMLQRLSPKERAAYLLHEVFDTPYGDVAAMLQIREPACRKLVSRAKSNLGKDHSRYRTPARQQGELLHAFEEAVTSGDMTPLAGLLSADVRLTADGGGKVPTLLAELHGVAEVTAFLSNSLHGYWHGHVWDKVDINGQRGAVIRDAGKTTASLSFAYDEQGKVTHIYIVRNPQKLASLGAVEIH